MSQWLNGEISPKILNHHKSEKRRTNNDLEGFHSIIYNLSNHCLSNKKKINTISIQLSGEVDDKDQPHLRITLFYIMHYFYYGR